MTAERQVQMQLQADYEKFFNSVYSGAPKMPKSMIDLFKKGIMAMPAFSHKINFTKVAGIVKKDTSEVTIGDVNDIVKVVMNTPVEKLFDSIEEAVPALQKIERFIVAYNSVVDEFQKGLEMKKQTLMNLSGLNGGSAMRIIN